MIALSILLCIVRCCCCGLECCCGVCSCCNACCPSPRDRRGGQSKYADGPPQGYNNTGYQSHPPPAYNAPAQYAQFDSSRKGAGVGGVHADALPAMPSWDTAASHRVPDHSAEESHEMDHMTPHDEQNAPMLAHQAASPLSGAHPDSFAAGAAAPALYRDQHAHPEAYHDAYARQDQNNPLSRYGQAPNAAPLASPYASQQLHPGAQSPYPQQDYAQSPSSQEYGHEYGQYGQPGQGYGQTNYGVASAGGAGQPRTASPPTHSPAPTQQGYGYSSPSAKNLGSASPVVASATALPGALKSGGTAQTATPPSEFKPYGGAYSQPQSQSQYAAYKPAADAPSTHPEPAPTGGNAAPTGMRRPGQHEWQDI